MLKKLKTPVALLLFLGVLLLVGCPSTAPHYKSEYSVFRNGYENIDQSAESGVIRFAAFGDVQAGNDVLKAIIKEIEDDGEYGFAVVLGDMVENPTGENYASFCDAALANRRKTPMLFIPGNHDVRSGSDDRSELFEKFFGATCYSFMIGKTLLVGMDNASDDIVPGRIAWLKNLLEERRDEYDMLVVFMHIPPVDMRGGGRWHAMDKSRGEELLILLKENGAVAIFCGHIHSYCEWDWNGISIYVSGGGGAGRNTNLPGEYHFVEVLIEGGRLKVTKHPVKPLNG